MNELHGQPGPTSSAASALRALGAGGPGRVIPTSAGDVFVAERGAPGGVPVIALHAIGHGSADFLPLAERLGDRFRFLLPDWPGHGLSPASGAASVAAYVEMLAELVPRLVEGPAIVLGNSIGGGAALGYAARFPERVRGLVLCDAAGLAPVGPFERLATRLMSAVFAAGDRGASWYPWFFRNYYRLVLPTAATRARRQQIIDASGATAGVLAAAWRSFGAPEADLRALAAQVAVPVWLAWARGDRIVSFGKSRAAAATFPAHEVTLFEGGHAAFLEEPDAFAAGFRARFGAGEAERGED